MKNKTRHLDKLKLLLQQILIQSMLGKVKSLLEHFSPPYLYRCDQLPSFNYLCRKALLLRLVNKKPSGCVLEIGFGQGDWLLTLLDLGFEVFGIEVSKQAVKLMRKQTLREKQHAWNKINILVGDFLKIELRKQFDIVFALEVVEHIRNDEEALRKFLNLLKPGGKLILSVPAHMKYWTQRDVNAGHYRRYEKLELVHKLRKYGFRSEKIWCYGFPLGTLISLIGAFLIPKFNGEKSKDERTRFSGVYRPLEQRFRQILDILVKLILPIQLKLQELFLEKDFGHGYLILASKQSATS